MSSSCPNCANARAPRDIALESKELTTLNQQRIAAEGIRAKELEAHGELTRRLQVQVDSHRHNEKELQLSIAKVRAEKCRLEADFTALQSKYRLLDQEAEGKEQRHEKLIEDYRQRLLAKEEETQSLKQQIQGLLVDKAEAGVKLTEKQIREEAQELCIQRLTNERDEAKQHLLTNTTEIARLTAEISKKQSEIDLAHLTNTNLSKLLQLEEQRDRVLQTGTEVSALTKTIEKLEISRLRLASWKRSRWDIQRRDLLLQSVFLEWKTEMLAAKAIRTHQARTTAVRRVQRVEKVHSELSTKLMVTKATLQTTKSWLQAQQQEVRAWTQLSATQFTTLVMSRLRDQQCHVARIHGEEVASLKNELQKQRDHHHKLMSAVNEAATAVKNRYKQRMEALVGRIQWLSEQKLRLVAFQGWKDVHLRTIVAETTHAVMVARAAHSIVAASRTPRSDTTDPAQEVVPPMTHSARASPKANASELRQPRLTIDPQSREVEEDQWKRWRRVTPTGSTFDQDGVRSRRSSITSSASRTSTKASTPTSQRTTTSTTASKRQEETADTTRRRASIV